MAADLAERGFATQQESLCCTQTTRLLYPRGSHQNAQCPPSQCVTVIPQDTAFMWHSLI